MTRREKKVAVSHKTIPGKSHRRPFFSPPSQFWRWRSATHCREYRPGKDCCIRFRRLKRKTFTLFFNSIASIAIS
uniref:Uncharacterized protein n=1 Tax=Amphimedon queenslandica TaxID=400682 RepID=A0A1X7UCT9_AMPQE